MREEKLARKKNHLWACLLLSSLLAGSVTPSAWAAETAKQDSETKAVETEEFSLEDVTVTALRYKSKNLETPADVSSYSREQLKATGATNLADALKYQAGLLYSSMGPHGQSWGSMTSEITIRGVDDGTLVMLNGVPINMNGKYYLEKIPLEQVEKVEVLKGGGSVLYGSEALGGIINIITRDKVQNSVTVSGGSDGQSHSVSLQAGKSSFNISLDKTNDSGSVSDLKNNVYYINPGGQYYTSFGDATKNNLNWHYKFDDHFSANYSYGKDEYSVNYKKEGTDALLRSSDYIDETHRLQLAYNKNGWSSKAYFNRQHEDKTSLEPRFSNISEKGDTTNTVYGVDTQKSWPAGGATWLAGTMVQRETFEEFGQKFTGTKYATRKLGDPYMNGPHDRNHYALYLQWDKELGSKNRLIIGAREDVVKTGEGQRFDALSPQLQFLHRLDENRSMYLNASKSFRMPTFSQLFKTTSDNFISNPNLKPETGFNQEIGYKYEKDNVKWKVAAFHVEVKDKIVWQSGATKSDPSVAMNVAKFRNTGIEASYDHKLSKHWSYSFGSSFGNPEQQESDGSAWTRTLGRMTFNGALHYMSGPWTADLSAMYYGDRVDNDGLDRSAMIPVSLHVGYKLKENRTLTFDVDNLLNRRDVTTNSSAYYMPERSFRLGLTATF